MSTNNPPSQANQNQFSEAGTSPPKRRSKNRPADTPRKKLNPRWYKWNWADWLADTAVQLLPRETKSVWMDMLARMSLSDECGYFVVAGKPINDVAAARLLGFNNDVAEYIKHVEILEQNN